MKIVLFADDIMGMNIARYIADQFPQDLSLIVTIEENNIFDLAQDIGIPTCVFNSEESILARLPNDFDLGILAWWPKILKKPLIEIPRQGFFNTHPSLLPYGRGKHPNFWALVEESPFGVTLHRVDVGVDTGEIVAQQEISFDWEDNGESLYMKAQDAMLNLFRNTYPALRTGMIQSILQNNDEGSSHRSSEIEVASHIDLEGMYRARDILNLLRARTFEGHPGCWFEDDNERYEISIEIRKVEK
ncbi:MAG: formyl transferase [Woeseiaceae bacterium]|nr:formyl transferase [Woeseiaceae bacterium]